MGSLPPPGIASRALTARLRIAFSSCAGSAFTCHRPAASTVSTLTCSPSVRSSSSLKTAYEIEWWLDFRRVLFRSDRKSTRLNSSHHSISYAVFCLKKNTLQNTRAAADEQHETAH